MIELYPHAVTAALACFVTWFLTSKYYGRRIEKAVQQITTTVTTERQDHGRELELRNERERQLRERIRTAEARVRELSRPCAHCRTRQVG